LIVVSPHAIVAGISLDDSQVFEVTKGYLESEKKILTTKEPTLATTVVGVGGVGGVG